MKAIIEKKTVLNDGKECVSVYFLGLRVYRFTLTDKSERKEPRPAGFVQFPIDAPSVVDEEEYQYLE